MAKIAIRIFLKGMVIVRYSPPIETGLSSAQVRQQQQENLINYDNTIKTKSASAIILRNVCTLFNLVNVMLALAIISVGSYKNMLFMGVVISNLIIGIVQEIRAKRTIDKLSLLHAKQAHVIRDGQEQLISLNEIVLDDLLSLFQGHQVAVDCIVRSGSCQADESFITGESDAVEKNPGDSLLAGSFIISGQCCAQVEKIGADTYISSISREAKYYKKVKSEMMETINRIIRIISLIIFPVGLILLHNQLGLPEQTYQEAVVQTVAALIGMIPEGLMLLTSTVLAVSVVRLAKQQVMVQELYCIETLARVDVLCLDKTGTITEGSLVLEQLLPLENHSLEEIEIGLNGLTTYLNDHNSTFRALQEKFNQPSAWPAEQSFPFSSQVKRSAVTLSGKGTYILGAAEFILPSLTEEIKQKLNRYSNYRVLLLAHSQQPYHPKEPISDAVPLALVLIKDKIRPGAQQTLAYFAEQDVKIKIISGDSLQTVTGVAKDAGVANWRNGIDMTTIHNDTELKAAAKKYTIFARVTPVQKKALICALKEQGHTVGMTGDGVNDVLALKESDCSIAMASGSDAARNISQLVLLQSDFEALPQVVAEGRRSINNIQRSASLFLVKTTYATLFALIFLFIQLPYPFIPIQLTLISSLTIGIPSFLLALEPNHRRVQGGFFRNIISKALPGGLTIVINLIVILLCAAHFHLSSEEISTLCLFLTGFTGFLVLKNIAAPLNRKRSLLLLTMIGLFIAALLLFPQLFAVTRLSLVGTVFFLAFLPINWLLFHWIFDLMNRKLTVEQEDES